MHNLFLRDFATEGDIEGHGAMNPISHRNAEKKILQRITGMGKRKTQL